MHSSKTRRDGEYILICRLISYINSLILGPKLKLKGLNGLDILIRMDLPKRFLKENQEGEEREADQD